MKKEYKKIKSFEIKKYKQYFNYLNIMIIFGTLFFLSAYCLTVYGLTAGFVHEDNPFMRELFAIEDGCLDIIILSLIHCCILAFVIVFNFYLKYVWQFYIEIGSVYYWIRVVTTIAYVCFALYWFMSGLLDVLHDIAVLYGVWWLYE